MKIISVVGVRKSGKTTTVEILIEELKKRGYTVGTVKTINCPMFTIEENEKSNTLRHKKAGADVVCASAKGETAFIYDQGLGQNRIFEKMQAEQVDYLILEGDYQSDVPRIICAHEAAEIPPRITKETFLVSGRIADQKDVVCGLRAISAPGDREGLIEAVLDCVEDISLPVTLGPIPKEAVTFCQHACKKACERKPAAQRQRDRELPNHIFLTGEKQVGKSTIWKTVLEELEISYTGFCTCPFELNGEKKGYYMHGFGTLPAGYLNDTPISVRSREKGAIPVTEAFDTFGADVLMQAAAETSQGTHRFILMDELGKLERDALKFQQAVRTCLDSDNVVLGVLQKTESDFLEEIKARDDVTVYTVTKENREEIRREVFSELFRIRKILETSSEK